MYKNPEDHRRAAKARYDRRKADHRCGSCGGQDERTLAGRAYCEACRERLAIAERMRYAYLRGRRRCGVCGQQDEYTLAGAARCVKCAERCALAERRRRTKKEAAANGDK